MSNTARSKPPAVAHESTPVPFFMPAQQEFNSLEAWLCSEEVQHVSLREVELGQETRGRELLRLLMQAHIHTRGSGDVGSAIRVFESGRPAGVIYAQQRMRARHIVTLFGEVNIWRIRYGAKGKPGVYPLDEQLQLPPGRYSYEIQRRLVRKAVQGPFDEAVESLREATGIKVPKRVAEQMVIQASKDFDSFYLQRQAQPGDDSGPIVVAAIDCKGIPMVKSELADKPVRRGKGKKAQKKKMATVAAVFTHRPSIRTPEEIIRSLFEPAKESGSKKKLSRPEKKRVWASLQAGKDVFIGGVSEDVKRRDLRGEKLWVVLTDGERALQIRARRDMPNAVLVLDIIHVLGKLWEAGHALYGEGGDKATKFVRNRAFRILCGGVSQVVKGLRQIATKRKLKGKQDKAVRGAAAYFYKNRNRMRYDEYLRLGLRIGTGSVEGACKNLIKDRMERSGMRWGAKMAEAMVRMRATYLSGDFDEYWNFHVAQEQNRLHPKGRWKSAFHVVKK